MQLPARKQVSGPSARGSSAIALALGCPREFGFSQIVRLRRIAPNPDLVLGTLVHDLIAYRIAATLPDDRKPEWCDQPLEQTLAKDCEGLPQLVDLAQTIFSMYCRRVPDEHDVIVLAIEQEIAVTIAQLDPTGDPDDRDGINSELVTIKPDFLLAARGFIWLDDHKTQKADYRTGMLPRWRDDNEFSRAWQSVHYRRVVETAAKLFGWTWPVGGWVLDRIAKKDPYDCDKQFVKLGDPARRDSNWTFREAVRRERQMRLQVAQGQALPPDFTRCWRYGRQCDYAPICWAPSDKDAEKAMNRDFAIKRTT